MLSLYLKFTINKIAEPRELHSSLISIERKVIMKLFIIFMALGVALVYSSGTCELIEGFVNVSYSMASLRLQIQIAIPLTLLIIVEILVETFRVASVTWSCQGEILLEEEILLVSLAEPVKRFAAVALAIKNKKLLWEFTSKSFIFVSALFAGTDSHKFYWRNIGWKKVIAEGNCISALLKVTSLK